MADMKNKCMNLTEKAKANLDAHLGVKKEVHENSRQRTAKLQNSWTRNLQMRTIKQQNSWEQNLKIGYGAVSAELVLRRDFIRYSHFQCLLKSAILA